MFKENDHCMPAFVWVGVCMSFWNIRKNLCHIQKLSKFTFNYIVCYVEYVIIHSIISVLTIHVIAHYYIYNTQFMLNLVCAMCRIESIYTKSTECVAHGSHSTKCSHARHGEAIKTQNGSIAMWRRSFMCARVCVCMRARGMPWTAKMTYHL